MASGPLGSLEARRSRLELLNQNESLSPLRDLAHYLNGEFRLGLPLRLTTWHPDSTGQQLSDRMVSRLELLVALRRLPYRQRRVIELLYVEDKNWLEAAEQLHIANDTLASERIAALARMIAMIYEWPEATLENSAE